MECTQRLECTQDAYDTGCERTCPEQIGFLGICGAKYPVKKGPNKIGRDPQTCSIILNDNSISRQHAVINILNKKDFMLMDLDSCNKTKLLGKILQPYIPHPFKNGDTLQFGQVFGIFRLLEEDDDLPMTQAVEIPDTPVYTRHVSRLKTVPITTIPESPDVSDRDDSFITLSPKKKIGFNSPNNNFIKSSGKVIGIQKIGTNKIDNAYWNLSKKSDSFNSNYESNSSYTINKSYISPKKVTIENSIHDMETQAPALPDPTLESIYEANTQVPGNHLSPTIYSCETQIPNMEKLPEVFKVSDQSNVRINLYSTNENFNIFEAKTQVMLQNKEKKASTLSSAKYTTNQESDEVSSINKKLNSSDEEICFKEIDCQQLEDEYGSQPLLSTNSCDLNNLVKPITESEKTEVNNIKKVETANVTKLNDSGSKDCEEIAPSQLVIAKPVDDEDVTDCEDNMIELSVSSANQPKIIQSDEDLTDCEDGIIEISQNRSKTNNLLQDFDVLPTQIIPEENVDNEKKPDSKKDDVAFEDMLTQVIEECPVENNVNIVNSTNKSIPFEDQQTQVIHSQVSVPQEQSSTTQKQIENDKNFKRPHSSSILKKKDVRTAIDSKSTAVVIKELNSQGRDEDDQNYYDATQEILNDLCSQSEEFNVSGSTIEKHNLSSEINNLVRDRSSGDSDASERIDNFVSNLSKKQVREVIGGDVYAVPFSKKKSSDSSDLEITPKKFNSTKLLTIDLPNSQDIKSSNFLSSERDDTDSSDGFEDTEEQDNNKPLIETHKRRRKKDVKLDLMKKFDINTLPTRVITRIRKPTSKISNSDGAAKKITEKIFQSNLGIDSKYEIDGEILQLNLKRLRSKMEKSKTKTNDNSGKKSDKDEKDVIPKHFQKEQNLQKTDKEETKKHISSLRIEKELKQQNIKSMFKEPSPKVVIAVETSKNVQTETIDSSHKSRRSSRNKSKRGKEQITEMEVKEVKSDSREKKKSSSQTHHRKQIKETYDLTDEKEVVVRRSRRHQTAKDKYEDKNAKLQRNNYKIPEKLNTVSLDNNEHSTVYNLSSETGVDSPTNLKRKAISDVFPSKTKKAKPSNAESIRASSLRGIRNQYVLFTAFPCEAVKHKLERLGAVTVSDVKKCTVVLTLQIKRTFKLLCAMGLGKPIVGPNWVQACADSNMIVDPWLYLIKDEATEKRFGFNLRQSLTCKRNFLKGYNVSATPNVQPSGDEMKSIVECSGGTWNEGGRNWFCVSGPADKALWAGLRKRGATLVSTEFILGGVLQQRMNLDRDKLV